MEQAQSLQLLEQASAAQAAGRFGDAQQRYEEVLSAEPQSLRAHYGYALLYRTTGHPTQAEQLLLRALGLAPHFGEAWLLLSLVYKETGRLEEAVFTLAKVAEYLPHHWQAGKLRAELLLRLGRNEEAVQVLEALMAVLPEDADVVNNLAVAHRMLGRSEQAERFLRRCLELRPEHPDTLTNLADVLTGLKQWDEAERLLRRSLELQPGSTSTLNNLGIVLSSTDRGEAALQVFDEVLRLNPAHGNALMNKGCVLFSQKRIEASLAYYEEAHRQSPADRMVTYNLGTAYLRLGRFEEGWIHYEARLFMDLVNKARNESPLRLQPGQDLAGKRLLLYCEQGLGDSLQFLRYAPLFEARGATVFASLQAPLLPLRDQFPGIARFFAQGEAVPEYDVHCSLLSAPHYFGTRLDSVPAQPVPWEAPAAARLAWADLPPRTAPLRVALVWAGNPQHTNDHRRSLPFEKVRAFVRSLSTDCEFLVLQKELRPGEAAALALEPNVRDLSSRLDSFADTAALLEKVDLLVSVDTSVVHLAGGMGRPTWVLLPFLSDWRWMDDREDSPWYPSLRLWRQPSIGDWDTVLKRVAEALREKASDLSRQG